MAKLSKEKQKVLQCPNCGKEFNKTIQGQKYCCIKCTHQYNNKKYNDRKREKLEKVDLNCKHCNKKFLGFERKNLFCSPKCGQRYHAVDQGLRYNLITARISATLHKKIENEARERETSISGLTRDILEEFFLNQN